MIAQTSDGYLWLAASGLFRFDGAIFERIDWPAQSPWVPANPTNLMARHSGELWIGLKDAPWVAAYRRGQLVSVGMPGSPGPIAFIAEDPSGTLWFASRRIDGDLLRLREGRWDTLPLPRGYVTAMAATKDGSLWIAQSHAEAATTVARLQPGARQFQQVPGPFGKLPMLAVDPRGALWVADTIGTRVLVDANGRTPAPSGVTPFPPDFRRAYLAFDGEGSLWRTSFASGISYVPHALESGGAGSKPFYRFTAADGLSSDVAFESLVDHEGNIWITSDAGIDQFRRASATQETIIPPDPINGLAIARANDGSVYILSGAKLFYIAPGAAPRQIADFGKEPVTLCPGRQGGAWVVQPNRLSRLQRDGIRTLASYGEGVPANCAEDGLGRLWVTLADAPLVWRDNKGWHRAGGALAQQHPWEISATRSGDIAFNGRPLLGTIRGTRLTLRGKLGVASMVTTSGDDVFLGDVQGLVRLRDGAIKRLESRRFPWLVPIQGLLQTRRGETWLLLRTGIARIATSDFERAFADPQADLPHKLYDRQHGLISFFQHPGFRGTQMAEGGDGRVWFLNRQGAAYFDPGTLRDNRLAPPVAIRSLVSGGTRWRDPANLLLPAGTRALDISYAGLSFTIPQHVHFRYRLEGVDRDWTDAGNRRFASYTNLEPGRYRFRVIAANADGVWNRTGATLDFEILPTFWQSGPFKLLCAVGLLGLLWAAYALRLRVVAGRIRLRMTERFEERERIARELHDTLLQGIQAVTLRFQRVVNELPDQQPVRGSLLQALDIADHVIAEGRDRVQDLRSRPHDALAPLLRDLITQQFFAPGVEITVSEHGRPHRLEPLALDEIVRIAGEALANVRCHAGAARVDIDIHYGRRLRLRIADDGVGIDPAVAEAGKAGHFGLRGMRERARKLRATLALRPVADHGTELVLTVPGRIAYLPERRSWWARIRRVR